MPIEAYLTGNLGADLQSRLTNMAQQPNAANYFGGNNFFREGTVQGLAYALIEEYFMLNPNERAQTLRLMEQPYPNHPALYRADILIVRSAGNGFNQASIVIEVKANFQQLSVTNNGGTVANYNDPNTAVEDDLYKMESSQAEFTAGFAVFLLTGHQLINPHLVNNYVILSNGFLHLVAVNV